MRDMAQSIQRIKKCIRGKEVGIQKQKDNANNGRNQPKYEEWGRKKSTAKTKRNETKRRNNTRGRNGNGARKRGNKDRV